MNDPFTAFLLVVAAVIALVAAYRWGLRRIIVFEYERGLRYSRGRFDRALEPGPYWYIPFFVRIDKLDVRPRFLPVNGQEVLTSDAISLKVSLAARYEIVDPHVATHQIQDYQGALYLELQLALREIIGSATVDEILEKRGTFAQGLLEATASKAEGLGLKLHGVNVKDIMFPGALKQTFAQVVQARKEGQAALERARGETAALRSLANAARMMEENPALLQLRLLHALAGSAGNTLVLGLPPESFPVASNGRAKSPAAAPAARKKATRKKT
ncbi:MAG: slipin family protein [Planctomycetota bacterium]|nr:slipin family protein [Planctomycetota bacterium]